MEIKIETVKKISPGIPKVIRGNRISTEKTLRRGGITYAVYEMAFTGKTNKSGQILLYENQSADHPSSTTEYFVAMVIDSKSEVQDASVDGNIEYALGFYTQMSKLISIKIHVVGTDGSVETAITWSDPSMRK